MSGFKKTFFLFALMLSIFMPQHLFAKDQYYGLDAAADQAGLTKTSPGDVPTILGNVIGAVLTLIGVIFFVLMVYGGFMWMTAHGDSGQVDKGKETIIGAMIGIIIVLASYAITSFVLSAPNGGPSPDNKPGQQNALGCCRVAANGNSEMFPNQQFDACQARCPDDNSQCTFYDYPSDLDPSQVEQFCNNHQ